MLTRRPLEMRADACVPRASAVSESSSADRAGTRAQTRREEHAKTTAEWLRRLQRNEARICESWGAALCHDYRRYLSTCVRALAGHWSSDVQMKLRHVD